MRNKPSAIDKLLFIASFFWAMNWGVRVAYQLISTTQVTYF